MNPIMIWAAHLKVGLHQAKESGHVKTVTEYYANPLKSDQQNPAWDETLRNIFSYADGMEVNWTADATGATGGRLHFMKMEHVFQNWEGKLYESEDLTNERMLAFFKPFDLITDETQCGFLHEPDFESQSIYYNRSGEPALYDLDLDFKGYLDMALASRIYYYWPKVLLDIQSGEESVETENFKVNMPKIFPDFSSLRLSQQ